MRSIQQRVLGVTAAGLAAAGVVVGAAAPAAAATEPPGGCVTHEIHLDPAAREAGWTVECVGRRYVFADVVVFSGGVATDNPREARWVEAGETWKDRNVYEQTDPPIDHLCVHLVSYEDPTDPLEIPGQIGHRCV
ncbi:hypothetical protein SAMN05421810_101341 [Amycolatopsis arida]|uniref:Secreted protein n=1 Tax=Amycolatopsis arida TaxID=587909 RepID=A0A1I5KZV7_9PSEU|nr:hypothetical protein [Amycolatopsis arida]TDX85885.1 hypothetical protein CLV69_11466 [Amycolatopsis arida]SFO90136.1 hypothetical protein SAMN05421810_101341 [Amycolatopsis arida]